MERAPRILPTVPIGEHPTPFEELRNLSREIRGPRIWVKRDDLTGLAMGGSKTRALSTLMGQALAEGADTVITCGPVTSNHARLTAAAAGRLRLNAILVLRRPTTPASGEFQGNMLLNHVLGASVVYADVTDLGGLEPVMAAVAQDLRSAGAKPFIIPGGGYSPVGAAGYMSLVDEVLEQAKAASIDIDALVVASGSGCIQSGLLVGLSNRKADIPVFGLTINRSIAELRPRIHHDVHETAHLLGLNLSISEGQIRVLDDYLGPGYAMTSLEGMDAIDRLARLEGLLLDPCYTGKAMAGLLDLAAHEFRQDQNVVFIHTGGIPGIFSYSRELARPHRQQHRLLRPTALRRAREAPL